MANYGTFEIDATTIDSFLIDSLKNIRFQHNNIIINLKNTKGLSTSNIDRLEKEVSRRIIIRIDGGYSAYKGKSKHRSETTEYKLDELKDILKKLEKIENGISKKASPEQKLFYFIAYLRKNIIYPTCYKYMSSKDIRSLRGLLSNKSVCAGYALILKELCDRNDIPCEFVIGSCSEEDYKNGHINHAWNIITLNGKRIPLDLTWVADESAKGNSLNTLYIANVNEYVKKHMPKKNAQTEDELFSLDGKYVRAMLELAYKDYEEDAKYIIKPDRNFVLAQTEERIVRGEPLYTYLYQEIENGKCIGNPIILYSKSNLDYINGNIASLTGLLHAGDNTITDERKRFKEEKEQFENLLLSKKNIDSAIEREDYYLGKVKSENQEKQMNPITLVDLVFSKELHQRKQKSFVRDDGSSFVLEDCGKQEFGKSTVNCYKLYEIEKRENKYIVKQNTIFTDENILTDTRPEIANIFFARERIDRKRVETGGYLGFYSTEGTITYNPDLKDTFINKLYQEFELKEEYFKGYYPDLTLDDMEKLVQTYKTEYVNEENPHPSYRLGDGHVEKQARFSQLWFIGAGINNINTKEPDIYKRAFEDETTRELFNIINESAQKSIYTYGTINPIYIKTRVISLCSDDTKEIAKNILLVLLGNENHISVLKDYYLMQNPSAIDNNEQIIPLTVENLSNNSAREGLEELKGMIDSLLVVQGPYDDVQIVPYKR